VDCRDGDKPCEKRASLAIWGGIGIASLASAIGISVVQSGRVRARKTATVSVAATTGLVILVAGSL
jgi:hypothetical protein